MNAAHIVCPHCDSINRIPGDKPAADAKCGRCHRALFEGSPVELGGERLAKHLSRNDIPVLVDFWAEWCGPCKMMAPAFKQAAQRLEPRVRLAKVDTERNQQLATQYGIRSIPTLILFVRGREVGRQSGAMDLNSLLHWVERQTDL